MRVEIAFVVLALVPRAAAAAGTAAAPTRTPAADADDDAADAARPSRAPDAARAPPLLSGVGTPTQPFSDGDAEAGGDSTSRAADDGESDDAGDDEPGAALRALSCLEGEGGNDSDGARRGVQKRDFMKKRRVEISVLGGYYASDALSSTYIYGGALSFFPSEDFGLELLVARNPVVFRLEEPFSSFDREQHFQASVAWNVLGAMLWSPVHAKLRWGEHAITHADLFLLAGAGRTANETVQGLTFQAGAGIKLYLNRFLSVRFDVRDLLVPQEVLGRGRTTHNLVTLLGLSGWVPG